MIKAFLRYFASLILTLYLKFVYLTTRWNYVLPFGYKKKDFDCSVKTIFAIWHNRLAIVPYAFKAHKNTYALVSPHSDGKIISNILRFMGHKVIEGSTNRNPLQATRKIISALHNSSNIVITPDGPKGPKYEINSNIMGIARMTGAKVVPMSAYMENNIKINSWDELIFPLPFGKGVIYLGEEIESSENDDLSALRLKEALLELSREGK
ncbi:MAG: lysophospholipid acyltransferase family protein [Rickettsiaceae bacterium]|nr:lysophospholipid acyltransferase family protein [Rickettsiaceae bacterium]